MAGYLIAETTREEREKIVAESLGNIEASCDGCMAGLAEMYQEYIDGTKEIRDIQPSQLAEIFPKDSSTICFLSSLVVSFIRILLISITFTPAFFGILLIFLSLYLLFDCNI